MSRWSCVVAACALGCHGTPAAPTPPQAIIAQEPIQAARGGYIAAVAGCNVCHVRGGGPLHAPNITPDPATGIGTWNDQQVVAAVRQGIRPDGMRLSPMMPYPFYHGMTDDDLHALVIWLRTQPPRRDRVARRAFALAPIVLPAALDNVDPASDREGHGRYLVGLMHCAGCHGADFSGGQRFGDVVAPNITSDPETGIGKWTEDDIIRAIREMKDPEGHRLRRPMADYRASWAKVTDMDLDAVATFIQSIPAVRHEIPSDHEHPPSVSTRP